MADVRERLAKVEEQVKHLSEATLAFSTELYGVRNRVAELNSKFDARMNPIEKELQRYRGFLGGILFIGAALVAFVELFWGEITKWYKS